MVWNLPCGLAEKNAQKDVKHISPTSQRINDESDKEPGRSPIHLSRRAV